jgi:uroporphyrinogen-III synthase
VSRPVLILRPEPGASATAARAAALGLRTIVAPLFQAKPIAWTAPEPALFDAILVTSANAMRLGGNNLADFDQLPLYAVGEATAVAARAAGFHRVTSGSSDVAGVLETMADAGCRKVLHLAGHDRTPLGNTSVDVMPVTVYASELLPVATYPEDVIVLLHSARAARHYASLMDDRSKIAVVAISQSVADAAGSGWRSVLVPALPLDSAMLALAASLCETHDQ